MALAITSYSINLDTNNPNCEFKKHLMQGSTDGKFVISLLKDGVEQAIDSGAKISMVLNYGIEQTCSGIVSNKGNFVLNPNDQGYSITISQGKIEIPFIPEITNASGINQMILKIEDGATAYTYSMVYNVDYNAAVSPISTPDNLPTYEQVKAQIAAVDAKTVANAGNIAANTGKINTNTGDITTIKQDIVAMKAKDSSHDGDLSQIKSDVTNLKAKDTALQDQINNDILPDLQQHNLDIPKLQTDLQATNTAVGNKANLDMSNVGDFASAEEGSMLYKKGGTLSKAPIKIDDTAKEIQSDYSLKVPPNSIHLGDNIRLSENGGFVENDTQTLGKAYLMLDYENDPLTGTKKPIYYKRGAKEIQHVIHGATNVQMALGNFVLGIPDADRQVQAFYLNLVDPVQNLVVKAIINGKDVAYYPSKMAWNATTPEQKLANPGYNKGVGVQKFDLDPFFSSLVEYNITLSFKADAAIRVMGDGANPYYAVDMNPITRIDMATMDDIQNAVIKDTPAEIKAKLESLTADNRLDASAIKNLPSGSNGTFLGLTDTPASYLGNGGKVVAVKADHTGLEFVTNSGGTTPADTENAKFSKSFGVMAANMDSGQINAGSFAMIAPKADGTFAATKLTHTVGYKGELLGYVRNSIPSRTSGYVELITTIQTGATTPAIGQAAYIGFDTDTSLANVQISTKDANAIEFGRCGVFGEKNSLGEAMAMFNAFQVEAEYLIDTDHQSDVAFYDNLPAVIDKKALFVHLVANIVSSGGIIFQNLPTLADVKKGMQIMIENQSTSEMSKVTLQAIGADKIDRNQTLDVIGGNIVTLIATKNGWIEVYNSKKHNSESLITVGELHGDYHQGDVKEMQFHNGLDVTIDLQNKVAGISLSDDIKELPDEVARLKTEIPSPSGLTLPTFSWRDKGVPTLPLVSTKKYKAYYIHMIVLKDDLGIINIPNGLDDGTIISIENNDRTNFVMIAPPLGETINSDINAYKCDFDTLNFFVKNGSDWLLAYGGVFPNSLTALKSTIEVLLPNQLNTISEIQAQLKDRLHTFREVQTEFSNQLHTFDDIDADMATKGYTKGISVQDEKSNVFAAMDTITLGEGFTALQDPNNTKTVKVVYSGSSASTIKATDSLSGLDFEGEKLISVGDDITIAQTIENGKSFVGLSKGVSANNEWIVARLGHAALLDSKRQNIRLGFEEVYGGGAIIYEDKNRKSFVVQAMPKMTSTDILVALYLEPDKNSDDIFTQDGKIKLYLADANGNVMLDKDGNEMASVVLYKTNQKVRSELYVGVISATVFTDVHFQVGLIDFANQELMSLGDNSALLLQAVVDYRFFGDGLLKFEEITGQHIDYNLEYFGFNYVNFAKDLVYPMPMLVGFNGTASFGNGLYFNAQTDVDIEITNDYNFHLKANANKLPVCNFYMVSSLYDTEELYNLEYKISCIIQNTGDAFDLAMLKWDADTIPPDPKISKYENTIPTFPIGWTVVDTLPINETPNVLHHTETKSITVPDTKYIALVAYPRLSDSGLDVLIKDIEVDIIPAKTLLRINSILNNNELYAQNRKEYYRFQTNTPAAHSAYRFTVNNTETKIPFGKQVSGDNKLVNAHDWFDAGSYDGEKVQGDGQVLMDVQGYVMRYGVRAFNEGNTENDAIIYLVKNGVEIANTRVSLKIEANRQSPFWVGFDTYGDTSKNIPVKFAKDDKIGIRCISNKDDGFYVQSDKDGQPLAFVEVELDEVKYKLDLLEQSTNEIKFMQNGQEVYNKILEYDVGTGKMKVVDR